MWRRLVAGGVLLILFRAVAALAAASLVAVWAIRPLASIAPKSPFQESGDIKLGGLVFLFAFLLGGASIVLLFADAIVYVILSLLPVPLQLGVGIVLILAPLAFRIDRPGHFAPLAQLAQSTRRMSHPAPRVPPFSLYISPAKERELRREGPSRMRAEWIGDSLQLTNLTAESVRLRIDFYGAYSHNSSINCRGDRDVPVARLPIVPAHSTYAANRVVCGDGFKAYSIWAWNDAGEIVFHQEGSD
jgi:hypothetical protein